MKSQSYLALAIFLLLSPSAFAQHGGGHAGGGGGGFHGGFGAGNGAHRAFGGGMHEPAIFRGGSRGPIGWESFHHDTSPAKVFPHRYPGTNLPRPGAWRGNMADFDLGRWQSGDWHHVDHGGRLGWWWTVGPDWYFYDTPVYPYPDLYTPVGERIGWWYWCDPAQEYYPYVTSCPVSWESVMPQD
jgi:hypothetical protein